MKSTFKIHCATFPPISPQRSMADPTPLSLKGVFDFNGNVIKGNLNSKTATRLVREWIDLRINELQEDWELARAGKEVKKIVPLD